MPATYRMKFGRILAMKEQNTYLSYSILSSRDMAPCTEFKNMGIY